MKRYVFKAIAFSLLYFFVTTTFAAVISPVAQLNAVASNMLGKLAADKRSGNKITLSEIKRIVNTVLMPQISVKRMAGSVIGRNYWMSASKQQREEFIHEFKNLVVCTYAAALSSYNDDKVQFYPLRQNYRDQSTMQVSSVIVRSNGQRIPISYSVIRSGKGWKVYDFSIENVSIVQSYNAQFASVLAQSGLGGLVSRLRKHNKKTGCA